jgi:hypothetical protein
MRMSQVLRRLADEPGDRVTIRSIFAALSDRSFALLIVLLGLPNCLPMPPPIPAICAVLLVLVALQIGMRRPAPWLPYALLNRSIKRADLGRAIGRALPMVSRLERWSRPRLQWFDARTGAVLSAAMLIAMAVGMLTAAPFIGQVPFGLAVCLLGLGQAERDGLLVLSGLVAGLVGTLLSASFVYAIIMAIRNLV